MEEKQSVLKRYTSVMAQVGSVLNRYDLDLMDRQQLKLAGTIKRLMADARLDIRDWEMAGSRAEMLQNGQEAVHRLEQVRGSILLASEQDLFSTIEVAETSAQLDMIMQELRT